MNALPPVIPEPCAPELGAESSRILRDLEAASRARNDAVRQLSRLVRNKSIGDAELAELFEHALAHMEPKQISQTLLGSYLKHIRYPTHIDQQLRLVNFKKLLLANGLRISPGGNNKLLDYAFSQSLGISTPRVIQSGILFDELDLAGNVAIKPASGAAARNVFLLYGDKIVEAKGHKPIASKENLRALIGERHALANKWISEQLITNGGAPSHDYKVYVYYGEVGAVLEIERKATVRYCWYNSQGNYIEAMMQQPAQSFKGRGIDDGLLQVARTISANTPTPFLRVDCFRDDSGLYHLGEITPHPGRYAGGYSSDLDQRFGRLFFEAEARLFADLFRGESFDVYKRVYMQPRG